MADSDTLDFIASQSKAKLAKIQGEIPIGQIVKAWCEDNGMDFKESSSMNDETIWHFRGASVRDADKILKHAQDGNHNMASCHAIHIRVCNETGKREFRPHQIDKIVAFDPEIIMSIISYMGGYDSILEDANPDVDQLGNDSESTKEQT